MASALMWQFHLRVGVRLGDLSPQKHSKLSVLFGQFADAEDIHGAWARVAEIRRSTSEGINKDVLIQSVVKLLAFGFGLLV